ncbi:MAG: phosphoribosylformylglycinamidine synthase [Bacteroidota bacterium]
MILFFKSNDRVFGVHTTQSLSNENTQRLQWLFGGAIPHSGAAVDGFFIGPRKEMITPWSTNAVEIAQNMGVLNILRIEEFLKAQSADVKIDPMLQVLYHELNQDIFTIEKQPEPILYIDDIVSYNKQEGLALSSDEIDYLEQLSKKLDRKLTDSEVFGFSQVNSEHCRHKIFNGQFIIDGVEKPTSLFKMIKRTSQEHPNRLVSAYSDNVAFVQGPKAEQFCPKTQDKPDFFAPQTIDTVISLKAETHNFPTTVEPFNGAATGAGGEIRDRMAGGTGSIPMAGTAVYMTSSPRLDGGRSWENKTPERAWLYQTPEEILIKASNGASDFGNKFGQPLICGSLFTFEHIENQRNLGFDKVIMLAGGIGHARAEYALKKKPVPNQAVVVMGGDNYRIGMGGGAVSSVATGEYANQIELNAVQRSNPEMQKRTFNVVRALSEMDKNPVVSIHDHGAGGHLNCLSELVEATGGDFNISNFPVGDPTLSSKEIIGNESQERMGLVVDNEHLGLIQRIADRERAPMYVVGKTTDDNRFHFHNDKNEQVIDLQIEDFFGNSPKTVMVDKTVIQSYPEVSYDEKNIPEYLQNVLRLEGVACKDWLTNKVDRSVTGKIAQQQTCGTVQVPLSNLGAVSIDFRGERGIATSLGHAVVPALINPEAGSRLSIAEALTNLVWAPLEQQLAGISLSANWMWPCKNEGEDARLYDAVSACSDFACDLGINIPTGKDSLSMTQKYPDGTKVVSPGTVIVSAVGEVTDVKKIVTPNLVDDVDSELLYVDFSKCPFELGGSSFAQTLNAIGTKTPDITDTAYFGKAFNTIQQLIEKQLILAGHDISDGGLITALFEMMFPNNYIGLNVDLSVFEEQDIVRILFSEKPAILIQVKDATVLSILKDAGIEAYRIAKITKQPKLLITKGTQIFNFDLFEYRDIWFESSYLLDIHQSGADLAAARYDNYKNQELRYRFNSAFEGTLASMGLNRDRTEKSGIKAAIIREKGVNCDRETAYTLWLAGFDVIDVHITDLISGRADLSDVNMIVFVGGFSNSDVLGSAKGWAGAFLYNPKAKEALDNFYKREDTLSLGICNGCQLMVELGLIYPQQLKRPKMKHNDSHKHESAFINVDILENNSVMLSSMANERLGVWISHGEGKFNLPYDESEYNIPMKYSYSTYPGNPNGSAFNTAAICSPDGRHLAIMPHPERAIFPWQWAYYEPTRNNDEVSPWLEAFVNARKWIKEKH